MKPILSVSEMRRVDAKASADVDLLMDAAGFAVALAAVDLGAGYGTTIDILCGKGNNGGDGYVAATYLSQRGAAVRAHSVGDPSPGTPAHRAMCRAQRAGVQIAPLRPPKPTDLVIDAVVGTGFQGELAAEVSKWIGFGTAVVAVDIPSGLNGDTGVVSGAVFDADITVAFHALKPGHVLGKGPDVCGEVRVIDIGLSGGITDMMLMDDSDVFIPRRGRTAHKWSSGAVATIGGMPGLTGAALLAAQAALAAGAGVSNLVAQPSTARIYTAAVPDIPSMVVEGIESHADASSLVERLARFDTIIVGPGLEPASRPFIEGLVDAFDGVLILDAGALNALSSPESLAGRSATTVLTPHAGEFTRLTGEQPGVESARHLAEVTGAVVVLKGNPTLVVADRVIVINSGGPELATIGSGDVLAGIIGAFVATSPDPVTAVASAVHLHGVAGSISADLGTVTASELLTAIGPTVAAFSALAE